MKEKKALKRMFIWWHFEKEQREKVEEAILNVINNGKKCCVVIGEIDEKEKANET